MCSWFQPIQFFGTMQSFWDTIEPSFQYNWILLYRIHYTGFSTINQWKHNFQTARHTHILFNCVFWYAIIINDTNNTRYDLVMSNKLIFRPIFWDRWNIKYKISEFPPYFKIMHRIVNALQSVFLLNILHINDLSF